MHLFIYTAFGKTMRALSQKYRKIDVWSLAKQGGGLGLTLVFMLGISGCVWTQKMGPQKSARLFNEPAQAFLRGDYELAHQGFAAMTAPGASEESKTAGRYGLACLEMILAKDTAQFISGLDGISSPPRPDYSRQNPELLVIALRHGLGLVHMEQTREADRAKAMQEIESARVREVAALAERVKELEHQITTLEQIDQQVQEKRRQP